MRHKVFCLGLSSYQMMMLLTLRQDWDFVFKKPFFVTIIIT